MGKKRKGLTRSVRFEVFKRDSFKCQYCGAAAPEAVLHVDHIEPVSKGGENDIVNLITACMPCNLGKKDRRLDDNAAVMKARTQLEELQERREQLEMVMEWKTGLCDLADQTAAHLGKYWEKLAPGWIPGDAAKAHLRKLAAGGFTLDALTGAMDAAAEKHLRFDSEGKVTKDSWSDAFGAIQKILKFNKACDEDPELRDMYYIRGIVRKRVYRSEQADWKVIQLIREARDAGVPMGAIKKMAMGISGIMQFHSGIEALIAEHGAPHG